MPTQCIICKGSGFVKYETKLCEICNGGKCMYCNSTGYEKMPWDLCETCYGDGEIKSPRKIEK
jgi:DnaJ-class molecular chaperone